MRADRLVAILLMLQSRGRITASEVASELEISERTVRREWTLARVWLKVPETVAPLRDEIGWRVRHTSGG